MTPDKTVAFVGQGPNRESWERARRFGRRIQTLKRDPDAVAEDLCRRLAITGSIGTKLAKLLDLERAEFVRRYPRRFNLNARFGGKNGKGDAFDRVEAQVAAKRLLDEPGVVRYVLLGNEVARAFGMGRNEPLSVIRNLPGSQQFLLFPHPSGINQWWNEPFNRFRAKKALLEFLNPNEQRK